MDNGKNNELIISTNDGFEYFDMSLDKLTHINNPEINKPQNRFNDGKCDKMGRFFAGTMDNVEKTISGSLYWFDGKKVVKKEDNLFISNGLGWNNDSSKFYLTDSPKRVIYVYDYDLKTGEISNKKEFANIKQSDGYPDGLCVDSENYIWSTHWNGGKITRYAPDGSIDSEYKLPVPNVTCCAFGGKNLDILYITTAQKGLSEQELKDAPLSGYTFFMQTKTKGQKPNLFLK